MREIRFRGMFLKGTPNGGFWFYWSIQDTQWTGDIDEERIGQFTGLYDKDGNEIYEGDILQIGSESSSVDYVGSSFRVMRKQIIRDETRRSYVTLDVMNLADSKVIGNIHESPELITE